MTPTEPRLIDRVLTVVAAMMLVAGVIAMHSLMAGHMPMARPGSTSAAMPQHSMVMTAHAPASGPTPIQRVAAGPAMVALGALAALSATGLTAQPSTTSHGMVAMCLAVLPALVLLLALALLRRCRRQIMTPPGVVMIRQPVAIRGSPPRRTTPSLSQLCILRT